MSGDHCVQAFANVSFGEPVVGQCHGLVKDRTSRRREAVLVFRKSVTQARSQFVLVSFFP